MAAAISTAPNKEVPATMTLAPLTSGHMDRVRIDPAIDFDVERVSSFVPDPACGGDVGHRLRLHEGLATKAGAYRHDQQDIDDPKKRDHPAELGVGTQGKTALATRFADLVQSGGGVVAGFDMDSDVVGTRRHEARDVVIGPLDHQVNIQWQTGVGPDLGDEGGAKGNVVDEPAVHDIEVKPVGASRFSPADLLRQPGPVGGKNAGGDDSLVEIDHTHDYLRPFDRATFHLLGCNPRSFT